MEKADLTWKNLHHKYEFYMIKCSHGDHHKKINKSIRIHISKYTYHTISKHTWYRYPQEHKYIINIVMLSCIHSYSIQAAMTAAITWQVHPAGSDILRSHYTQLCSSKSSKQTLHCHLVLCSRQRSFAREPKTVLNLGSTHNRRLQTVEWDVRRNLWLNAVRSIHCEGF